MTTAAKQVIYVDVDDEITAIIDKINNADARVIALVLPKRASVFQSIVNMKLLKRRVEQANKHLVLITSETGLMPLAGMAGVYVAQTLQSKPEVPAVPSDNDAMEDIDEDEPVALARDDFNPTKNANVPVGALAAGTAGGAVAGAGDLPDDMQELDKASSNRKAGGKLSPEMAALTSASATAAAASDKKSKKFSVPNFFTFRKRLIFIILGLIVLIALWYVAWFILPTASVSIKTKTTDLDTALDITLDTNATAVDTKLLVVPAKIQQQQKNNTQQAPATGTENKGDKATGSVTLSLADCSQKSVAIPAGTGLSTNGLTFITQESVTLSSIEVGGKCRNSDFPAISTANSTVTAQKGGVSYNIGPSNFTVAVGGAAVQASSKAAFTGGTDENVKIVQQADIDAAKQKMASGGDKDTIKKQLQKTLEDNGLYAIQSTFQAAAGDLVTSAKVGDEAEAVTVSETATYTMYGAKKADIRKLIETSVASKIDKTKQSIIDDGIDSAKFAVGTPGATPTLQVNMALTAVAGPQLNAEQIKTDMVGKKSGVVKDEINANPGVEDVIVKYSPFWVTKAPEPAKTTITFEKTSDGNER